MKLLVDHAALRTALALCAGVVKKTTIIPILANVHMYADGDVLILSATDLDLTVITRVACVTREDGVITCELAALLDIARTADAPLTISTADNGRLDVITGGSTYKLLTLPAEDFPTLPDVSGRDPDAPLDGSIELLASEILPMLRVVGYAETDEDKRFQLAGALVVIGKAEIDVVSSDGHRMALCQLPHRSQKEAATFLPTRLVQSSGKLAGADDADVMIAWTRNHVSMELGATAIIMRRPEGAGFPDYKRMVFDGKQRATLDTRQFESAAVRVAPFAKELKLSRAIVCDLTRGKLVLYGENINRGHGRCEIDADYDGDGVKIGWNGSYLADAVRVIETDAMTLEFTNADSAFIMRPIGSALPFTAVHVLMPLKLD